jgi:hypothetical protein
MFFFLQESFYFAAPGSEVKSIQNKKIETKNLILITTIPFTQTKGTRWFESKQQKRPNVLFSSRKLLFSSRASILLPLGFEEVRTR